MSRGTLRITEPDVRWEDAGLLREVLDSGWLTGGPKVRAFEEALGAYLGVGHVVACSAGTAALLLSLEACGLGAGADVLVPAFTFPATANAVERVGARPVLVDIALPGFNLDLERAEAAITPRTRALLPVHQFGLPMDLAGLEALADRRGLVLVEDAACALGAEHEGRKCGTVGRAGCFSFHPRKVVTTGEGGAVVSRDAAVAETCRQLRNHGLAGEGAADFTLCGTNLRLSDLHAALGLPQLERLEATLLSRARLAELYSARLAGMDLVQAPVAPAGVRHGWQSYVLLLDESIDRDACIRLLREKGIEAVVPGRAIHALPYYRKRYGYGEGQFANAERAARSAMALPLFPGMGDDDVDRVATSLCAALDDPRVRAGSWRGRA